MTTNDAQPENSEQRTVRVQWAPVTTNDRDWTINYQQFTPPDGWFVEQVLPAFADNGAGVVFVLRPIP